MHGTLWSFPFHNISAVVFQRKVRIEHPAVLDVRAIIHLKMTMQICCTADLKKPRQSYGRTTVWSVTGLDKHAVNIPHVKFSGRLVTTIFEAEPQARLKEELCQKVIHGLPG